MFLMAQSVKLGLTNILQDYLTSYIYISSGEKDFVLVVSPFVVKYIHHFSMYLKFQQNKKKSIYEE